jgi:hypothetical protein
MDTLLEIKNLIEKALQSQERDKILQKLQEINHLILTECMIKIDKDLRLYPIEVEAYYYNELNFSDTTVHRNELQKNRFDKLYFHRAGSKEGSSLLYDEGGIDICLSSGEYYFGVLIRSARVNAEEKSICGPGLLTRRIVAHVCKKEDSIIQITDEERSIIRTLEEKEGVLVQVEDDKRDKKFILNGKRFGIRDIHKPFSEYNLRSLIELKQHPFKDKERMVISHFKEIKEKGGVVTINDVVEVLGYKCKAVFDALDI